ncbi:phospholipid/cholesterol/gamma-HCH transport system ATP-binding protein [Breznakibacter xylanolyticus]|uniref:Phospholipid/cholesterol/gamma-HCH transport system ATP-binding protein n=1 Tax=Breznakibacter xylanolyticus TaxID=990 RepID=A0A2W7NGX1_9BACT|nr:ATP-binding cassette domain-containing protein [Breznakibacter xylanolyticus]MBN2743185.1 ATP-binding cassette domain-containing protein [Marinilabiliaceae bacterium]PZX15934.1 phospholipid/cholesterol/gamma-HCH transport system ATP-binding protein [Breznakibacter xylanolyticus]
MIEIVGLRKSFEGRIVLDDISASFEKGKTNLIIGQSGSGKTVLIKSIVGLHQIDDGAILYDGRNFIGMNSLERKNIRKEIGMLFQGSALFDYMTVEENVRFPLDMFSNMSLSEKDERVNFCLKRVNLENANQRYPSEISGGMQKRVAIARAISLNPRYLICDEPNSGLDPRTSIVIDELIREITTEYDITTIVNTHDMNSVMGIGEKIIFLHEGVKHWEGTKDEIFDSDNEVLNDFVFASELFKKIRRVHSLAKC